MLKNHRNKLFVLLLASAICIPILLLDLSPKKEEPIVPQEPPINYEEKYQQASHSLSELQQYFNRATDILNKDKFTLESNYIPIVIYVYRRPYYLEKVLQALSQVKGIEKTILVVSHDSTMPEMLDLVRNISFCQVKQLFHPVSPVGRDSTSTTLKLHWYWLQNTLWADIFPNHNGDMVFLEEDHIVSPDFYETAKMLSSVKHHGIVANVSTIALGSYFIDNGSASTFVAFEGFMNTGYGFNRTIWQMIKANEYVFNTSHYDWDTSLAEGLMPLRLIPYKQISPHLTRICNIGSAGGLHTTQVMANLCEKGLYPISNGQVDWSELVLYELGDSPRENKNQFKDRLPVEICRGNTCFE